MRAYARAAAREVEDTDLDGTDARVDARARSAALAEGLAGLRGAERDVLLLFAWAELSYEELSVTLGIPVGTVRSRLSRAREHLRAALEAPRETSILPGSGSTSG